ncbi:MAG TPA: molybdopterin-binding protein [Hyphomonadaceae bacterium]|nr:molybdopterin-binding protein [Hyphomonadaceae bacterium]
MTLLTRRNLLTTGAFGFAAFGLAGCDPLSRSPDFRSFIKNAEGLTMSAQRALMVGQPLAREFSERDMSRVFRANGSTNPDTPHYNALAADNFQGWTLTVDGLVNQPQSLSLPDLRNLPSRTQITRHDCVEGWSAIGKWKGVQLATLLQAASLKPNARFAVFHCADDLDNSRDGSGQYYESIDLIDAFHPQTILAYEMNGAPLEIKHGAPIRLRVERQLGYKQAKYVMRIEIVERLDKIRRGKGGYWEDRGYEWYAGI